MRRILGGRPSAWGRFARVAVLALLMIPVTRSVVVAGAVEPRFERAEPLAVAWKRLVTSPPFDAWAATGSAECGWCVMFASAPVNATAARPVAGATGLLLRRSSLRGADGLVWRATTARISTSGETPRRWARSPCRRGYRSRPRIDGSRHTSVGGRVSCKPLPSAGGAACR